MSLIIVNGLASVLKVTPNLLENIFTKQDISYSVNLDDTEKAGSVIYEHFLEEGNGKMFLTVHDNSGKLIGKIKGNADLVKETWMQVTSDPNKVGVKFDPTEASRIIVTVDETNFTGEGSMSPKIIIRVVGHLEDLNYSIKDSVGLGFKTSYDAGIAGQGGSSSWETLFVAGDNDLVP